MPAISVLIPAYNSGPYIGRCLESVINQTVSDIEIVIVDDGSSDNTAEVLREYAERDSRIKVIRHPENSGVFWARKTSIEASSGDYLMFVDSDDVLKAQACERLYSEALRTGSDLVKGGYEICGSDGTRTARSFSLRYGETAFGILKAILMEEFWHSLTCAVYERRLFTVDPPRYLKHFNMGEDQILYFRYVRKATCIPDIVYEYHQYDSSLMHTSFSMNRYTADTVKNCALVYKITVDRSSEVSPELGSLARKMVAKRVRVMITNSKGLDKKMIMGAIEDNGLSDVFSMPSLVRLYGPLKGSTYYLATHSGLYSRIVFFLKSLSR